MPADRTYRAYGFGFIPIRCYAGGCEADPSVSGWWEILMEAMMFLWWATHLIHRRNPDKPPIYVDAADIPPCGCPLCGVNEKE